MRLRCGRFGPRHHALAELLRGPPRVWRGRRRALLLHGADIEALEGRLRRLWTADLLQRHVRGRVVRQRVQVARRRVYRRPRVEGWQVCQRNHRGAYPPAPIGLTRQLADAEVFAQQVFHRAPVMCFSDLGELVLPSSLKQALLDARLLGACLSIRLAFEAVCTATHGVLYSAMAWDVRVAILQHCGDRRGRAPRSARNVGALSVAA
mmetsp:Transcript_21547/g.61940  ORF Transcript_21547/g.61940 Transcript_21547/m.61940 type:complete len:207 (+) Transcript_21547:57-677(+)